MPNVEAYNQRLGIALSLVANSVWGMAAFYWIQTKPASSIDVLAHRAVWLVPVVVLILWGTGRLRSTLPLLKDGKTALTMMLAAFLVAINWGVFLYAVTNGKATEASLGYFLLPILTVMSGIVVFRERPSFPQKVAIVLGVLAVGVQLVALGRLPVIALAVSSSFAVYSVLRKRVSADATQGLFLESLFLMPIGAIWLVINDGAGLGQYGWTTDIFLLCAGAFTALPLVTHVAASRLLPLSTIGLLSYLGPSLQLIVALTAFGETITPLTLSAFFMVWCGLAFILVDNFRSFQRLRRAGRVSPP